MEAKPCPFCKSTHVVVVVYDKDFDRVVECESCGANGPVISEKNAEPIKAAVEAWNIILQWF